MVSKERLGGFIDAIVAVVMTIMLLEFHPPQSGNIIDFLKENLVYLIAYTLSFIYVTTSWFNQQYMLKNAEIVTRKMYIATMLWVLSLSLLPVLAAWTGRTINLFDDFGLHSPKAPAMLFIVMIYLWGISYINMTRAYIADNPQEKSIIIQEMEVFQWLKHPIWTVSMIFGFIITYFYPPFVFIYTAGEMVWAIIQSRNKRA
ncbi:MAG: TMEM175 family protein [Streptococcaceae bacterium]|nr:TMEM175 family protein [Streptococcaceae bacterium]MCL2681087.1 TMEM175 family protein [Streptococcaceae bacterium]